MKETLQVGYIAEEFDRIEGRKTAVDSNPKKLERFYYPKNQGSRQQETCPTFLLQDKDPKGCVHFCKRSF